MRRTIPMPRLGIVAVHAEIPGRLRLKLAPRACATRLSDSLTTLLCQAGIVKHVEFRRATGSLLITHDRRLEHEHVVRVIASHVAEIAQGSVTVRQAPASSEPPRDKTVPRSSRVDLAVVRRDASVRSDSVRESTLGRATEPQLRSSTETQWHTASVGDIERAFETSGRHGLSAPLALRRRQLDSNALPSLPEPGLSEMLWRQVGNLPIGLLAGSALISIATGGVADALTIASVIGINALIGLVTERRAEKIIRSLSIGTPSHVPVLRGGRRCDVRMDEIVRGDLLMLSAGTYVAADARLVHADGLSVDESALTGESLPVPKEQAHALSADIALAERQNMVHRGTVVTGGMGRALVVACGRDSELGKIQTSIGSLRPPPTPLQTELDRTGTQLVKLSLAACGAVFLIGLARRLPALELLKLTVSLGVAAVPEGLPTVATSTLALGVGRMRQQGVAVRRLGAIEALGAMDVLCLDKTGTLTQNRMRVEGVHVGTDRVLSLAQGLPKSAHAAGPAFKRLLEVVALCNDSSNSSSGSSPVGSATESALLDFAELGGINVNELRKQYPRIDARYRSEMRRFMTTTHRHSDSGKTLVAAKGSPMELLGNARCVIEQGRIRPLEPRHRDAVRRENDTWSAAGMRVLGVAYAEPERAVTASPDELIWLGLVALSDPVRPDVAQVVHRLHSAGVRPVMITGDQAATAVSIGTALGFADVPLRVLESTDLSRLGPEVLHALARNTHVFARVSPSMKLSIVRALQDGRRVVGMTGDGVNDGPALRAASIGIAMGEAGQDVAKSIADIVLQDDNLATILTAIAEGRTIYDNIRKAIHYLLATNFSEVETTLAALAVGLPAPLKPMQLLWINLLTDIAPALALALEPQKPDVLDQPPRDPHRPIIGPGDAGRLLRESLLISGGTLASYIYGVARYGAGPGAETQAFATLTFAQLLHALICRSERGRLLRRKHELRNSTLELALGGTAAAQAVALFLPWTRRFLGTTPLGIPDIGVIGLGAVMPLIANALFNRIPQIQGPTRVASAAERTARSRRQGSSLDRG